MGIEKNIAEVDSERYDTFDASADLDASFDAFATASATAHDKRFSERSQSIDFAQENDEDRDVPKELRDFPDRTPKQRSVSLASDDQLRKQLESLEGSHIPIPIHFEQTDDTTEQKSTPFGVTGPGEIIIETQLIEEQPAAPLLYPIPSEPDLESDEAAEEPDFYSGSLTQESDFIVKKGFEQTEDLSENLNPSDTMILTKDEVKKFSSQDR